MHPEDKKGNVKVYKTGRPLQIRVLNLKKGRFKARGYLYDDNKVVELKRDRVTDP